MAKAPTKEKIESHIRVYWLRHPRAACYDCDDVVGANLGVSRSRARAVRIRMWDKGTEPWNNRPQTTKRQDRLRARLIELKDEYQWSWATLARKAKTPVRLFEDLQYHAPLKTAEMKRLEELHDTLLKRMDDSSIALVTIREALGLSQSEAATGALLSKHSLAKWEQGERRPSNDRIIKLWSYYNGLAPGLRLEWLLTGNLAAINKLFKETSK